MKTSFTLIILALIVCLQTVLGFTLPTPSSISTLRTTTSLNLWGKPKDDGSPGDYVCKDCGYVFTKGPAAWAKLSDDDYRCPPCGAPKFRFNKVPKGSASGKVEVKKNWFGK